MLQPGICYEFIRVEFNPTEIPDGHLWYLAMEFIMTLDTRTEARVSAHRIALAICPPGFPQFGAIYALQNKRITGALFLSLFLHITIYKFRVSF